MLSLLENKILGSLYGFAIGDAMGATMEFQEKITDESKKIKDLIGGGWLNLSPWWNYRWYPNVSMCFEGFDGTS